MKSFLYNKFDVVSENSEKIISRYRNDRMLDVFNLLDGIIMYGYW